MNDSKGILRRRKGSVGVKAFVEIRNKIGNKVKIGNSVKLTKNGELQYYFKQYFCFIKVNIIFIAV